MTQNHPFKDTLRGNQIHLESFNHAHLKKYLVTRNFLKFLHE